MFITKTNLSKIMLTLFTALSFSLVALLTSKQCYAEQEFTTDYKVAYSFDNDGVATVTQTVTITNLRSDVVASIYSMTIKQIGLYDIAAYDKNDSLTVEENKSDDETRLDIKLERYSIGSGRENTFTLKYKTKDIAYKTGKIWNINIPKAQTLSNTASYNLSLQVPVSFGSKIFVSPNPANQEQNEQYYNLFFTKDQINSANITAAFGEYQLVNFQLKYQLNNPNLFPANYEIALPSDIRSAQQVYISNLEPSPKKIYSDKDGNMIAVYHLGSKQSLEAQLTGKAKIINKQINENYGGKFSDIPAEIRKLYTVPQKYWESGSPLVMELASKIKTDNKSVTQQAKNIYKFLVENYSYDLNNMSRDYVKREGAVKALSNKSNWACMEFTDSFIALARAMGIPAREINGFALATSDKSKPVSISLKNGDFLHAWPEFYDPNFGWVQIDPTWGDTSNTDYFTKIDTNHFAFVVKGINSEYPLPAGTYRYGDTGKLVDVDFAVTDSQDVFKPSVEIKRSLGFNIIELIRGNRKITIENKGRITVYTKEGKTILPTQKVSIYVPAKSNEVTLYDFNYQSFVVDF